MAASPQIEDLQTLLRKQGFGSSLPLGAPQPYPPAGTGFAGLDDLLGGGIPRGQITELAGPASSGCTSLVLSTLAESTTRGEVAAYIDATDCFDPPSGEKAGIVLERLLWVRCVNSSGQRHTLLDPGRARGFCCGINEAVRRRAGINHHGRNTQVSLIPQQHRRGKVRDMKAGVKHGFSTASLPEDSNGHCL